MACSPIESFLIEELPDANRWKRKVTSLDCVCYTEDFQLFDEKACCKCQDTSNTSCGEKAVAKFKVKDTVVLSYGLEDYLLAYGRYKKAQGSKCDFLHIDAQEKRFVLNELTCSIEKYVDPFTNTKGSQEGKRAHAKKQMVNVIQLFAELPSLKDYMLSFLERIALFSWRIPGEPINKAEESMATFLQPQQWVSNITLLESMPHDFKFIQQIYPSTFVFD